MFQFPRRITVPPMKQTVHLRSKLHHLLNECPKKLKMREMQQFSKFLGAHDSKVVLVGSGNLGQSCLPVLTKNKLEVVAFADDNPKLWQQDILGLKVISLNDAGVRFGESAIFVVAIYYTHHSYLATRDRLQKYGARKIVFFPIMLWMFGDQLLPFYHFTLPSHYVQHADQVMEAFSLMTDEKSQNQFVSHLHWRMWQEHGVLPETTLDNQYFPDDLIELGPDEAFAEGGGYDGDTVRSFMKQCGGKYRTIHTFEPDPENFRQLEQFHASLSASERNKVHIYNQAIGARVSKIRMSRTGTAGATIGGSIGVDIGCVPLDQVLTCEPVTFLKLDVEGAEMEALRGAVQTLVEKRPITTVCLYHRPEDLYTIPLFLASIMDRTNFHLRTHDYDGRELVLYAIPHEHALA